MRIVETYRQGGKVLHRTLYNLGKVGDYSSRELENLGRKFLALSGCPLEGLGQLAIEEKKRYNYGFPLALGQLMRLFRLDIFFGRLDRAHHLKWRIFDSVCLMLCDRFQDPLSKLASHDYQADYIGLEAIKLERLYRSLDYLAAHRLAVQEHLHEQARRLTGAELDLVFYDVTTFYFESEVESEGALRQMGFGKDGKIGRTQVLFGLLIDRNRNPVGYEVYSGNTYEGHTFADSVNKLRRRYAIRRVVVVADSGMMNKDNIALFNTEGAADQMEFIVGERLRGLSAEAQAYLCDRKNYQQIVIRDEEGNLVPLQYAALQHNNKTLLATYSEKRAAKDRAERQNRVKKAEQMLKNPATIDRKAKRFYLSTQDKKNYSLDLERIERDARFDGILVLATNALDLTPDQILEQYKELYNIEQSFRTFKSFLESRPMFHWTDQRIEGHLCMCYIAFCLLSHVRNLLGEHSTLRAEYKLRRALASLQLSKIVHNNKDYYLRSAISDDAMTILKTIGITQTLNDLNTPEQIARYLGRTLSL
jgi:transposase